MIGTKTNSDTGLSTLPIGSALVKEAELWMGAQSDVLSSIETMMTGWMQRQRQALEASSRSMRKILDARNPFDLLLAQNEWVSDCLHWTASEIRGLGQDTHVATRNVTEWVGERSSQALQPEQSRETAASMTHQRAAAE